MLEDIGLGIIDTIYKIISIGLCGEIALTLWILKFFSSLVNSMKEYKMLSYLNLRKGWSLFALVLLLTAQSEAREIIPSSNHIWDKENGLDWLDLTETGGQTLEEVSLRLVVGGDLEGWRFATRYDFATLTMWNALTGNPSFNYFESHAAGAFWVNLSTYLNNSPAGYELGSVEYTPWRTYGLKGIINDPLLGLVAGIVFKEEYDVNAVARRHPDAYELGGYTGYYLVRSHVPEPHYLVTILVVGIVIISVHRRKKIEIINS